MKTQFIANFSTPASLAILLLACSVISPSARAQDLTEVEAESDDQQDFNLFEDVETNARSVAAQERSSRSRREQNGLREPEFTLVGTSRIGNRYSAILRNKDGSELMVKTEPQTNTQIEGFGQYSIVNVGGGNVSIQYPGSSPCVAFEDKGVSCNSAANIASLSLTNAEPLQVRRESPQARNVAELESDLDEGEVIVSVEDADEPVNPFAALRARAQANGNNAQAPRSESSTRRNFTPRRIDPADVPTGMRVVSTPFGDRLVEQ